jgi:hypothetical protein
VNFKVIGMQLMAILAFLLLVAWMLNKIWLLLQPVLWPLLIAGVIVGAWLWYDRRF